MKLLTDDTTSPVVLFFYCTKRYGYEWMKWGPEVLKRTLEVDHPSVTISKKVLNRALATALSFLSAGPHLWNANSRDNAGALRGRNDGCGR